MLKFLCSLNLHSFRTYEHISECGSSIYYLRECRRCGLKQMQNAGLLGDKKWEDLHNKKFVFSWEEAKFKKSRPRR